MRAPTDRAPPSLRPPDYRSLSHGHPLHQFVARVPKTHPSDEGPSFTREGRDAEQGPFSHYKMLEDFRRVSLSLLRSKMASSP